MVKCRQSRETDSRTAGNLETGKTAESLEVIQDKMHFDNQVVT